jgi:hypothetical protein
MGDKDLLGFRDFADLEHTAPNFAKELVEANQQGHAYVAEARGPIEKGQVKLVEFTPAYLKSHKIKPKQEIVRKTPQGELHIHFDANGLPAGADLINKEIGREHVTTNSKGQIMADDRFTQDGARTAHIRFDNSHKVLGVNIDAQEFDEQHHYLGDVHTVFQWDEHQRLRFAHSDHGNGVEDLHNDAGSKKIVTYNPAEGNDKDTYVYDPKTYNLDHLEFIDLKGKEYIIRRGPHGSVDVEGPLTRI